LPHWLLPQHNTSFSHRLPSSARELLLNPLELDFMGFSTRPYEISLHSNTKCVTASHTALFLSTLDVHGSRGIILSTLRGSSLRREVCTSLALGLYVTVKHFHPNLAYFEGFVDRPHCTSSRYPSRIFGEGTQVDLPQLFNPPPPQTPRNYHTSDFHPESATYPSYH
jgi:hypothetical protein